MVCVEVVPLIEEAKLAYADAGLECGDGLLPPASEGSLEAVAHALGFPLPGALRQLWGMHGGQDEVDAEDTGLFGWHRLLTPVEAAANYRLYNETCIIDPESFPPAAGKWASWQPELIPFASFNDYDLCVHAGSGEVWEFRPGDGLIRCWPSIGAVLRELIAAVRAGEEPQLG